MKEKKDELVDSLLRSKLNWWNRFCKRLTKILKVKSKDSTYQALVRIREDVLRKNSKEDKDPAYRVYLDIVKDYLETNGKRLLTTKEEEIVVTHLGAVAATFCNDPRRAKGLNITQVLRIATAKKVSEIHPDIPTQEQVDQSVEVLAVAVQKYLHTDTPEANDNMFENEKK